MPAGGGEGGRISPKKKTQPFFLFPIFILVRCTYPKAWHGFFGLKVCRMRKKPTLVSATVLLIMMGLSNPSRQPFRLAVYYYSSLGACLASPSPPLSAAPPFPGTMGRAGLPLLHPLLLSSSLSYVPGRPLPLPPPPARSEEGTGEGEKAGWVARGGARKRKNGFNFWRTHKGRGGVEKGDLPLLSTQQIF